MEMGNPELVKRICICICKSHGGSTAARINRFAFIYDRLVGASASRGLRTYGACTEEGQ
jgi:hypothetical protein